MKFLVKHKKDLLDLLKTAVCEGTIKYTGNEKKLSKPFFPAFYLQAIEEHTIEVEENEEMVEITIPTQLLILAVDPYKKKTRGKFILSGVEVLEEGKIPITDYEILVDVLSKKGVPKENVIFESEDGNKISIYNKEEDHEYIIRTRNSKHINMYNDSEIAKNLQAWVDWHKFLDDGTLIMKHPKVKDPIPFDTKIKVKKDDFLVVIDDAETLTYDNQTRLHLEEEVFVAYKGKENSFVKSKHSIPFELLSEFTLDFDERFYNLQTIVPNLFDEIILNIRRVKANDTVYVYVESEKGNIRAEIGLASIKENEE